MPYELHKTHRGNICLPLVALTVFLLAASWSAAEDLRWDIDLSTPGAQDGDGTWSDSTPFWSNNSTADVPYAATDTLLFGRGDVKSGTVTIDNGGALLATPVQQFQFSRDYSFLAAAAGDGIKFNSTANEVINFYVANLNVNLAARLEQEGAVQKNWDITKGSTLTVSGGGTLGRIRGSAAEGGASVDPGTAVISGGVWENNNPGVGRGGRNTVLQITGGEWNITGQLAMGGDAAGANPTRTEIIVNGGLLNIGGMLNMAGSNDNSPFISDNILTVVSGSVYIGAEARVGNDAGQGTINVQGGHFYNEATMVLTRHANSYNAVHSSLNVSGGEARVNNINYGSNDLRAFHGGDSGVVNLTGGVLYTRTLAYNYQSSTELPTAALVFDGGTLRPLGGYNVNINSNANGKIDVQINGDATFDPTSDIGTNQTIVVNSPLSGAGTLIKRGAGAMELNGYAGYDNTFSGAIDHQRGNLTVKTQLANLATLRTGDGTVTLDFTAAGAPAADLLNAATALNLSGGNLTVNGGAGAGNSQTFATTTLGGVSALTGNNGVTVDLGILTRADGGALALNSAGAGTSVFKTTTGAQDAVLKDARGIAYVTIGNGTDSNWAARNAANELVAFTGYTQIGTGGWDASWNRDTDLNINETGANTTQVTANSEIGTVRFNYADTATSRGIRVNAGQELKVGAILVSIAPGSWGNHALLEGDGTLTALDGASEILAINNGGGFLTLRVNITDNADGPVSLVLSGSSTVNFDKAGNTYSGDTIAGAAVVRFGSQNVGNANSEYRVRDGSQLNVNNQNATIGALSGLGSVSIQSGSLAVGAKNTSTVYDGRIDTNANGVLDKIGAGALTLTGNSAATFNGTAAVSGGTLLVNGVLGGAVTVADGATLGGGGVLNDVTVDGGGILAPGNSIGTLTVGSLTLNDGAIFAYELGATGADADLLTVNGLLTGHTGDTYNFTFSGGELGETYTLLTFGSLADLSADQFTGNYGGEFVLDNNALTFALTSIPEPSTWLLLGVGVLLVVAKSRFAQRAPRGRKGR
jgi:fibronectin-binding autotransporter adhesin